MSSSYSTAPKLQISARLSTFLPLACSGAIYAAVPRTTPTSVAMQDALVVRVFQGTINFAHAALADQGKDFVVTEFVAD